MMLVRNIKIRQFTQDQLNDFAYAVASKFDIVWHRETYRCLEFIEEYEQDAPTIIPRPDEQLIQVNLSCRYYGEGYERGPILDIVNLAGFLDYLFPNCEIWYGGDSSGVEAAPFPWSEREKLVRHYFNVGREPYLRCFGSETEIPTCVLDNKVMVPSGWGGGLTYATCLACKEKAVFDKSGRVLVRSTEYGDDFNSMLEKAKMVCQ